MGIRKKIIVMLQVLHRVCLSYIYIQYIPRNMHTVFALLCFVMVIHWLIFPYPSGLLHWHCGNLTIAPVPAKQPWWIWINTSCEFIMNDCITTTKQSTTKPCAYFLGYTVYIYISRHRNILRNAIMALHKGAVMRNGEQSSYRGFDTLWRSSVTIASTHWGRDKMADIFQTTLSNAFSWMKMYQFRLRFHWSLFPRVKSTKFHPWFR